MAQAPSATQRSLDHPLLICHALRFTLIWGAFHVQQVQDELDWRNAGVRSGLVAAESGLRYGAAREVGEGGKTTLNIQSCTRCKLSYRHTVQDRRQLPPLDSASSLVKGKSQLNWKWEQKTWLSLSFTILSGAYRSCKGWPLFCLSSLVLLRCSPVKATQTVITHLHNLYISSTGKKQAAYQDKFIKR